MPEITTDMIEATYNLTKKVYLGEMSKNDAVIRLCPNCHSMLHRKSPPYSIEELKGKLIANNPNNDFGAH